METASGCDLEDALNATFGFNVEKQKFDAGLMAEGTMDQCKDGAIRTVAETLGRETAEKVCVSLYLLCVSVHVMCVRVRLRLCLCPFL